MGNCYSSASVVRPRVAVSSTEEQKTAVSAPVVQPRYAPGSLEEHKYYLERCCAQDLRDYIVNDPQIAHFFDPMIDLRPTANKQKAIAKILKVKFGYVDFAGEPRYSDLHSYLLGCSAAELKNYIRSDLDVSYMYPDMPNFHDPRVKKATVDHIMRTKFRF